MACKYRHANSLHMKVTLKRLNDSFLMEAKNETGNTVQMDASPKIGGQNLGARPMEVLLMSLAGCSTIDVLMILKKMKQDVADYHVEVEGEREPDVEPSLYRNIHLSYSFKGDLDEEKVKRAIGLSLEKYCSVAKTLEPTATISWSAKID
jgi:putative redox protein